ncbi:MAG: hypothetical protein Barrevirus25_8 [Barrevirus sp.]|uniref:Phosphatidylethanolamine-binding protein n=1 Tax=Barrevirus sp. TaxID=2487763 RepID=A0A3G4ZQW1_9VIRU|nr:MAG: hypothetical protein Barrevirus25_8 [Barrevirus sp.]
MKELQLFFNNKRILNGQLVDLSTVQTQPTIKYDRDPNKLYTILMVDPDAPSRSNPLYKYVLHWLIINNNDTIEDFHPPNPPTGSGPHRYFISVYEQTGPIKLPKNSEKRKNFDIPHFINKHDLIFKAVTMFRTERK